MKTFPFVLLSLATASALLAAEPSPEIAKLASPDIAVRRAAVEAIQTLDDPGIPAACLPLLQDEGRSIRRQAARAIGSRFSDVPANQRKIYLAALKQCEALGPEDNALICQRAIGLLTGNFSFPSFSVGPRKKWVLYERRKLPVVTLVKSGNHELLSPVWTKWNGEPEVLKMTITNESADELFAPHWHSSGEAVAFTMILQRRFFHPIFVWAAGTADLKVLEPKSLKPLLPPRYPNWGTTSDFVKWDGTKAVIRIYDCDAPDGPPPNDPGVFISYDFKTGKLARMEK
ncbi:MAG: HEAT repeat domain-containing protein [Verrucomicrobiota bacterium]